MLRPGIEQGTFISSVWRSPNWAIAASTNDHNMPHSCPTSIFTSRTYECWATISACNGIDLLGWPPKIPRRPKATRLRFSAGVRILFKRLWAWCESAGRWGCENTLCLTDGAPEHRRSEAHIRSSAQTSSAVARGAGVFSASWSRAGQTWVSPTNTTVS